MMKSEMNVSVFYFEQRTDGHKILKLLSLKTSLFALYSRSRFIMRYFYARVSLSIRSYCAFGDLRVCVVIGFLMDEEV